MESSQLKLCQLQSKENVKNDGESQLDSVNGFIDGKEETG